MTSLKNFSWKQKASGKSMALAVLCALGVTPALASNLTVNSQTDNSLSGDGICSLREAINNANSNSDTSGGDCAAGAGSDAISFSVSGTIVLGSSLSISDTALTMLDGIGQNIILSGNYAVRVMQVNPGANFTVKNLTVANGFNTSMGGGMLNEDGVVSIINCTITGNSTTKNGGGIAHYTKALTASGSLTVINSTLSGNSAFNGGAIWDGHGGPISLVNSTITGNSAVTPVCPAGFVCALVIADGGGISNSLLGSNMQAGILNLENSIVAGNTNIIKRANLPDLTSPSDIYGYVTGGSYNLVGNQAGFYTGVQNGVNGNIIGFDAATVLATTLANNGGPTQTLALLPGSLAINTAFAANCPATDQRGVGRPQGAGCDIGAFEAAVSADLAIAEIIPPNPVGAGESVTWTIQATNNGAAIATGVKVIDTPPASGLTSISASTTQGSCSPANGLVTCNLGSLANGASATITIRGDTSVVGTLSHQVSVSGDQVDNQLANNNVSLSATVQTLLCNGVKPTIVGTTGPDNITGTKGRDVIHALGGNDTINGGSDSDTICGGEGLDILNGSSGNDKLNGGAGADSCNGGTGTDSATNCEASTSVP